MSSPLVSVILVCRNPGQRLRQALASVWAQTATRMELVVIDGASTDGTREWLESERPRIAMLVSEPDRGVYDAMNKGLAAARGEWVIFLGADDKFGGPQVLAEAAKTLAQTEAGVVVGEAIYDDGRRYCFDPATAAVRRNFAHHQAAFYRRSLLQPKGYDANLRYQADYDLNLRLRASKVQWSPIPIGVSHCASGGLSDAGHWANYREEIQVRHRHFPAWKCWFWDIGSIIRYLRKKLLRTNSSHG